MEEKTVKRAGAVEKKALKRPGAGTKEKETPIMFKEAGYYIVQNDIVIARLFKKNPMIQVIFYNIAFNRIVGAK